MGAWGVKPFENDSASDWRLMEIDRPIVAAIKKALTDYINAKPKTRADFPDLAEAAASLLVSLTFTHDVIDIQYDAAEQKLYTLALEAIDKALSDTAYIERYTEPDHKRNALLYLRAGIIHAQDQEYFHRSCWRMHRSKLKVNPKRKRATKRKPTRHVVKLNKGKAQKGKV